MNPCNECIVTSMCENECSDLVEYLVKSLNYGAENRNMVLGFKVAKRLRKKEIVLCNGDGDWRLIKCLIHVKSV